LEETGLTAEAATLLMVESGKITLLNRSLKSSTTFLQFCFQLLDHGTGLFWLGMSQVAQSSYLLKQIQNLCKPSGSTIYLTSA
jgi:spore maturation protein SpmA